MKKRIILSLFLLPAITASAQNNDSIVLQEGNRAVEIPETMPEFPGGNDSLMYYVATHTQYPADMMESGAEGRLVVTFVVLETGKVDPNSLMINKSVCYSYDKEGEKIALSNCLLFEEEAKRVVRSLPEWKPATRYGKAVKVKFQLPFRFQLTN